MLRIAVGGGAMWLTGADASAGRPMQTSPLPDVPVEGAVCASIGVISGGEQHAAFLLDSLDLLPPHGPQCAGQLDGD